MIHTLRLVRTTWLAVWLGVAAGLQPWGGAFADEGTQPKQPQTAPEDKVPQSPRSGDTPAPAMLQASQPQAQVAGCERHNFITPAAMLAAMMADLDRLKLRAGGTRYLTLTHLANVCVRADAMEIYRQGAIKLLNSLSRTSNVQRIEAIDPERTILRINIDDLGWDAADWDDLVAADPYAVRPDGPLSAALQTATGSRLPYLRADWFAFAAARPPLYNTLLRIGSSVQALALAQSVDIDGDIRRHAVLRAGFQTSGENGNSRIIERHISRSGYFWLSYDFAGHRARQSIFEYPLGPGGSFGFNPDRRAAIFSLPNGFQGYFREDTKSGFMDSSGSDAGAAFGISCMGCHQGVRAASDEVRDSVLGGRLLPPAVRDEVDALYPPRERMQQAVDDDTRRFAEAMSRAGLDPTANLDGVEPISALSARFESSIGTAQAAAELGITTEAFAAAVATRDRQFQPLAIRLGKDGVSRQEFGQRFAELINALTNQTTIAPEKPMALQPGKPHAANPLAPTAPHPRR